MSETTIAAAPVTGETPTTPTGTAPSTDGAAAILAPEAPQAPLSKAEAKRSMFEMFRQREAAQVAPQPAEPAAPSQETATPEPVLDERGRAHDPATGKFLPGGPTDAPAAETPPVDVTADAPAASPPGTVRLELPEALREQGRDAIEVPAEMERTYRALLNGYARRAEVEAASTRAQELEAAVLRFQVEQEVRGRLFTDPEASALKAKIDAVKDVDPEFAALAEIALEQRVQQQADQQMYVTQLQQAGDRCESNAREIAFSRYPEAYLRDPAFHQHFETATAMYTQDLRGSIHPGAPLPAFQPERVIAYLDKLALDHPTVRTSLRQQMEASQEAERQKIAADAAERARQEAVERERQRLADAGQRHADRNPLAAIASQVRTGHESTTPHDDIASVPAHQRKHAMRERLFGDRR